MPRVTEFTPWSASAGGILIGAAAVVLLWLDGRIAGVSGILNGVFPPSSLSEGFWRLAFLVGLVAGAAAWFHFGAGRGAIPETPLWTMALAGFLVGMGTAMGNGCTSGHGVCGLGRLSVRSLAATMTFLAFGILTVYMVRHVLR